MVELGFNHNSDKVGGKPYYTHINPNKKGYDFAWHDNLKSAVAHLKTFKSMSLRRASDKSK